MKNVSTAAGRDRRPLADPVARPEGDPELQSLTDGMAMLGRLDSELARFEHELGRAAPPGP